MRKIAVFTGNRAEYGLQFPLLKAIKDHPELDYQLIVSGAHLDGDFGSTLEEIQGDGFEVSAQVSIDLPSDSLFATANAIGTGTIGVAKALADLKPDMLLVYADRFEGFAAVIAGTQMGIPTAHVEGGDLTEGGALDDSVRHAMTKLAHLHFTTNAQATNRILGMGEEAWRVHTIGFPAIDLIQEGNYAKPADVVARLGCDLDRPIVLFTQHSVATQFESAREQVMPSLDALRALAHKGYQIIVTYPNNDAGGKRIISAIEESVIGDVPNVIVRKSLGRWLYHGVLALAQDPECRVVCVGNSSSGIKETPAFLCPAVDIGDRQAGRLRADNVVAAGYDRDQVAAAIDTTLDDAAFRQRLRGLDNPYGIGNSGPKLARVLSTVALDRKLLVKKMTLRGEEKDGWFR